MIAVVTDRRRRDVVAQVEEAAAAGVDLVQIRERDLEAAALGQLVSRAVRLTRGTSTRIVVNDRLDVALACGADGVHLRGDSMQPAAARTIAPAPFLIGRSVHSVGEAIAAGTDVSYLIAGTVYPTPSKPRALECLGVEGLRAIVVAARVPVLAIGGVTLARLDEIAATGAAGIAAIGLVDGSTPMAQTTDAVRRRFDRLKTAP